MWSVESLHRMLSVESLWNGVAWCGVLRGAGCCVVRGVTWCTGLRGVG